VLFGKESRLSSETDVELSEIAIEVEVGGELEV
jgi:hypothetical protein